MLIKIAHCQVSVLTWKNTTIPLVASGIIYVDNNGVKYTANARREVIVAAGAIAVQFLSLLTP
jgi:hypothetical protein